MGTSGSVHLPEVLEEVKSWSWNKLPMVLRTYKEGEYDFGVDFSVVMSICACEVDFAKKLIQVHSRNNTGIVNAVTLLITLASLADADHRNDMQRLQIIFDIMDFSGVGSISMDEFSILIICAMSSFALSLQRDDVATDNSILEFTKKVYDSMNKRHGALISKDEFVKWAKNAFFGQGASTVDTIYEMLLEQTETVPKLAAKPLPKENKEESILSIVTPVDDRILDSFHDITDQLGSESKN